MALIDNRRTPTRNGVHNGLCALVCVAGLVVLTVVIQWLLSLISF